MPIYKLQDLIPDLPPKDRYYVAPGAHVIGRVRLGEDASVWFNTIIRGDTELIDIGPRVNIQDNCVLHTDPGFPLVIGADATIGHNVILHGCTIGEGALIGMGATILNGAKIGRHCLVGANALITEGKEFSDNSLIVGAPAKIVRTLDEEESNAGRASVARYMARAKLFAAGLKVIDE
jgi:carbonic anhydrase/acetyltransferase-like protein (isoleucine patch superfamily)